MTGAVSGRDRKEPPYSICPLFFDNRCRQFCRSAGWRFIAQMLGLSHNRWIGELLFQHLLSTTFEGLMAACSALSATAGLLNLEF